MSKAVAKGIIVTWDLVGNLATETRWCFSLRHFFRLFLQQGSKPVGLFIGGENINKLRFFFTILNN